MESMSDAPVLYPRSFSAFLTRLQKARTLGARLSALASLRWRDVKPRIGLMEGLTDPTCGLNMGQTAEVLAREFGITRTDQDAFALESHRRAAKAREAGRFRPEITPLYPAPDFDPRLEDDGIRPDSTMESLARLRPVFDPRHGTVTAGNSSQITDGAGAVLVTTRERAAAWGAKPLARIRAHATAGLDPRRMGLGPALATAKVLKRGGLQVKDLGAVEINEAFAAQVLAVLKVFASGALARERLGIEGGLSALDPARVNPNGGAVALGHPVGASGSRLILTLAHEIKARDAGLGLATLCVGGGQGAAVVLERTGYTQ
jgi:acetyl-CoA acetyltransferase family protein